MELVGVCNPCNLLPALVKVPGYCDCIIGELEPDVTKEEVEVLITRCYASGVGIESVKYEPFGKLTRVHLEVNNGDNMSFTPALWVNGLHLSTSGFLDHDHNSF